MPRSARHRRRAQPVEEGGSAGGGQDLLSVDGGGMFRRLAHTSCKMMVKRFERLSDGLLVGYSLQMVG